MKFPSLIKKKFCKTPFEVVIYGEGITEDGAPEIVCDYRVIYPSNTVYPSQIKCIGPLFCNYQDKIKTVYTSQKKKVQATGVLLINGDICPNATVSSGYVVINGVKREIAQCIKARNPDGTVNYTQLEVM